MTPITVESSPAILLAEDDPVTRMLMTRFLKKAGYEVDAVANGTEALDEHDQALLPDAGHRLGDAGDGRRRALQGGAQHAARRLRLRAAATARDAKEHIIAGLEAGADDYLVKPVHEAELIARLNAGRRILALEHSLRAANRAQPHPVDHRCADRGLQPPLS